ncbi:hypothetical protein BJ165DRAFT_1521353 [Panaeolus papilionaceus]|nr:hypothetical protein BJ165DRAFT_1521353 [Panaeolus papilionaceus]
MTWTPPGCLKTSSTQPELVDPTVNILRSSSTAEASSSTAPGPFLQSEHTDSILPTHCDNLDAFHHSPVQPNATSFSLPMAQPVSESEDSEAVTRRSFGSDKLVIPSGKWEVATSWQLQDPSRNPIQHRANLTSSPMERRDLLHVQHYKVLSKDHVLALVQQVTSAEAVLNQCEKEEASLLLALDANRKSGDLEPGLALALARATRTTTEAKRLLADARLAHAKALVQQLVDEVEEASAMTHEADHQLVPIIDAFKAFGWHIDDITAYCLEIVSSHPDLHTPTLSPLTLAELKDTISKFYPRAPSVPDHSPASPILTAHELYLDRHGNV